MLEQNSLISVVVPYYNNKNTLTRALLSIKNQSYKNLEIIIVNDNSLDWSDAELIIKQFTDLRISIIHHQINRNGSAARNTGIKAAIGSFIALLDADDEWFPDHLKKSLKHYFLLNNKKVLIFCQNLMKTVIHKDIIMPNNGIMKEEKICDYLFVNGGFISTPSMFGPSSIFKENLFDESIIRHQDYKFLLDLDHQNIPVSMSNHLGVIVHWENNDIERKGGTWTYSLNWALKNKSYFSKKAFKYFLISNVVFPLLQKREKVKALTVFIKHCLGFYPFKFSCKIISVFFFGKVVYAKI